MRNYFREWLDGVNDREEIVYAPIALPRELFQILQFAGKKTRRGVWSYLSLTWILSGGLGLILGGLFSEKVEIVLAGAILALPAMLGLFWIGRGYKYRPGEPLSWGKPPKIVIFDEAGYNDAIRERTERNNAKLRKLLGKG